MKLVLPLLALAFSGGFAPAAVLITPTTATQVGAPDFGAWGGAALHANVINNSGLSGAADINNYTTITHANAASSTAWTTEAPGADYFAAGGAPAVWTFDLGQTYFLSDLVFWGYHFGGPNGNEANVFDLEFSIDGGANFANLTTVSIPLGSHTGPNAATMNFGGSFAADTVRLTITDNQFGGGPAGGDRLGVGEFKFVGVIPEPSSGLLAALGFLAFLRRRR